MRKGTTRVYNAWIIGKSSRKQRSIWTEGSVIYSYSTPIMWREADGDVVLNVSRYSVTTSTHQNGLRQILAEKYPNARTVER